ncbi:MAG: ABC transporter substrate-binding protein [Johnsonella sp.]|nr:ABC transporter substrate-binding protein [Johnsonella sp.]
MNLTKPCPMNMKQSIRIHGLIFLPLLFLLSCLLLSGCRRAPKEPVTLSIWHVYGAQTNSPLNDMIDLFNKTEGKELGINIEITLVSNTNQIHDAVIASSYHEPGAPPLPDIFISYPKTIYAMKDPSVLVDYRDYFSPEEISSFLPEFTQEGMIGEKLLVFPIAKSTELLFVNRKIFERFSEDTGAKLEDLDTWEGLFALSEKYAAWTDEQTPEIPNDGKAFFVHDYHFSYFQVGSSALGKNFFSEEGIELDAAFRTAWEPYAHCALKGGMWLHEGYATEPLKTADAVASVGSSASILYYSDEVIYPDNTKEKFDLTIRPCPVFKNGKKLVMQRGAGLCTVKSTQEREKAAIAFIKWITSPKNNVDFVTKAGYMPVTKEAFERFLPEAILTLEDERYIKLYEAFLQTNEQYEFYTPPGRSDYLFWEKKIEKNARRELNDMRRSYIESGLIDKNGNEISEEDLLNKALDDFCRNLR